MYVDTGAWSVFFYGGGAKILKAFLSPLSMLCKLTKHDHIILYTPKNENFKFNV